MIWKPSGKVGMVSEPYRVGKFSLEGKMRYGLFFNNERLGWFDTFEQCQEAAEAHAKGQSNG